MFNYHLDDLTEMRLLEEQDAAQVFALINNDRQHLYTWLPWVTDAYTIENTRAFIRRNRDGFEDMRGFSVGIFHQRQFAGQIGYNEINWNDRITEIGYWLGSPYQGKGLMTRACRVLVEHAFSVLHLNRVEIHCGAFNFPSRAIPERLGFQQEGILRQAEWLHDHFHDLVVYAMLAENWRQAKTAQ